MVSGPCPAVEPASPAREEAPSQVMRVMFDAHQLGRRQTGNETYVRELLAQLAARDDLAVTALVERSDLERAGPDGALVPPGVVARRVPAAGPLRLAAMGVLARTTRPDLLHAVYFAPWLAGRPVVLTVHDICFEMHPQWFSRTELLRGRTLIRDAARRARFVVTVSETSRHDIVERYGLAEERVVAIPNGVSSRFLQGQPAPVEVIGDRPVRALAIGTLQPRKNLLRLLAAARRVSAVRPVSLRVVGPDGHGARRIREALAGAAEVSVAGYLDEDALVAEYRAADMLVYPSFYEGFGLPVVEAMASGLPVITSTGGALPEVAGDAAVIVDPGDETAIAQAILRLADDTDLRRDLAARGRERARLFSWPVAADRLVDVYRAAVHG